MRPRTLSLGTIILMFGLLFPAMAEKEQETYPTLMEKTFHIANKKVDDVYLLVSGLVSEEGLISIMPRKSLLTVKDRAGTVDRISRVIANFDQPPDRVVLDVRIMKGVKHSPAAAPSGESGPDTAPVGVPRGLTKMLKYDSYVSLGRYTLDLVEGRPGSFGEEKDSKFRLDVRLGHVDKKRGIIVVEKFLLRQRMPEGSRGDQKGVRVEFSDILTNSNWKVVGRARSAGSAQALFVVLQGRIL